ncbi:sigma factor-like helix-turn-helix DNA-binding protein [Wukongibacter baidiensis]
MSIKELVIKLFYDEGLNISQVAERLDVSKQAVSKHLKKDNPQKYETEKKRRKVYDWNKIAIKLFYDEGLKVNEVAKKIGKSSTSISRYLLNDNPERYKAERERRKSESAEREKTRKRNWKKANNGAQRIDYDLIRRQHYIDVGVLSYERVR